jgi:hypothetical protein
MTDRKHSCVRVLSSDQEAPRMRFDRLAGLLQQYPEMDAAAICFELAWSLHIPIEILDNEERSPKSTANLFATMLLLLSFKLASAMAGCFF